MNQYISEIEDENSTQPRSSRGDRSFRSNFQMKAGGIYKRDKSKDRSLSCHREQAAERKTHYKLVPSPQRARGIRN
jgi:hypothetical protein